MDARALQAARRGRDPRVEARLRGPGLPAPRDLVLFWIAAHRYQFKVFKLVEEVARDDLRPARFKDALAVAESLGCDCS
jgi:hypothetical protein